MDDQDSMRILVVTQCFQGLGRLLFEGAEHSAGMPAQEHVLKAMIERGWTVDLIVSGHNLDQEVCIESPWFKKVNQFTFVERGQSIVEKLSFIKKVRRVISDSLENKVYDFVYFQGADGAPATDIVVQKDIPCGQRLFGSGHMIKSLGFGGRILSRIRYYPQYCAFTSMKTFLLVTNDGSKASEISAHLCGKETPYDLKIWNNGALYDQEKVREEQSNPHPSTPFILYAARIAQYKRQDRAIEILKTLREMGLNIDLFFAGDIDDASYHQRLLTLEQSYHLTNHINYLGNVPTPVLQTYQAFSLANMFMADTTNRGNSLIEAMAIGSPVVVLNDRTCDDFIVDHESGLLVDDCIEAAAAIADLLSDPQLSSQLRESSRNSCIHHFPSWEERATREIDLISGYVTGKDNGDS